MTLYKMEEWEYNGRDDSDWYAVVYDSEQDTLYRVETGTTRFANALHCGPPMQNPTPEIVLKAQAALQVIALPRLKAGEENSVMAPYLSLVKGTRIRLLDDCRIQEKETSACTKCNGSGHWVNPKNENDKRTCFSCSGSGILASKNKVKDENGKVKWIRLTKDMRGEILDSKVWGTFYRNGYNKPCRENTRFLIKFEDGNSYWIQGTHLRLDREIRSDEELISDWKKAGKHNDFYSFWRTAVISML